MTEARSLGLNYGHLGEPVYDSDNHRWHFARNPYITRNLTPLGQPVVALPSASEHTSIDIKSFAERAKSIKGLTSEFPELLPSTSLLPSFIETSEAIQEVSSVYDPSVSELLAYGQASVVDSQHHGRTVPIVAAVGGKSGELLRLVLLHKELLKWKKDKDVRLQSLSSRGAEECIWSKFDSPIQQLVFAEAEENPCCWLAVRYPQAIEILRPLVRQSNAKSSHLVPNHIVSLSLQDAHGTPFSNITFNPWNNQHIATINQQGQWSTWKVSRKAAHKGFWTIEETASGRAFDGDADDTDGFDPSDPVWYAIHWILDENTIIIAGRRKLTMFDIRHRGKRLEVPGIIPRNSADWILDIKKEVSNTARVFILTSSTIHWLHVSTSGEANGLDAQCLISWKHFRDPEDVSLRITTLYDAEPIYPAEKESTILVLLYSRANPLTTLFTFQISTTPPTRASSLSDPVLVRLPNDRKVCSVLSGKVQEQCTTATVTNMTLHRVRYDRHRPQPVSELGQHCAAGDVRFYKLSLLRNDLSMSECLYLGTIAGLTLKISPPDAQIHQELSEARVAVSDDFVVPDGIEDENTQDFELKGRKVISAPAKDISWTIGFEWLQEEIRHTFVEHPAIQGFSEVLEHIYDTLQDRRTQNLLTSQAMIEMASASNLIGDLDRASLELQIFLEDTPAILLDRVDDLNLDDQALIFISTLTPSIRQPMVPGQKVSVADVYTSLITTWLKPLDTSIPSRVRVALEKMVRHIAAQMCLASYTARFTSKAQTQEDPPQAEQSGVAPQYSIPMRRKMSATFMGKKTEPPRTSSSPPASSQISTDVGLLASSPVRALPTPEPTPSLHSQSSISSLAIAEDPASLELQDYGSVGRQSALPTKLFQLRAEWETGADPEEYDWEAVQEASANAIDENPLPDKKRQREDKKKKRQRELSQAASSQPLPKKTARSSTQPTDADTQVDSQLAETRVSSSYPVPGRHAGRKAKAPKSRPPGFR